LDHPFYKRLALELEQRQQNNLFRTVQPYAPGTLNLSSNDYLQLRYHPRVLAGAKHALERYGAGVAPRRCLGDIRNVMKNFSMNYWIGKTNRSEFYTIPASWPTRQS